jgi:hypothetical protein
MGSIANLSVKLSANISSFTANMTAAATKTAAVSKSFSRALDTGKAWNNFSANLKGFKLAGSDTLRELQTTLAVARSSLKQFGRNRDVQVAIEFGREQLDEAWIKAREQLHRFASATKLPVLVNIVSARTAAVRTSLANLRASIGRGINVPIHFAEQKLQAGTARVRSQLEALRRFRAVRIGLSLVDHLKLPLAAAKQALAPLRRLAGKGIKLAISATYASAVSGVKAIGGALGGLKSLAGSVLSGVATGIAGIAVAASAAAVGLFALVRHQMDAIEATALLAERIGTTTEKLSGLQYAAKLVDVSTDSLATGFDRMLENMGQAAAGTGTAGAAFAHLGLNVQALSKMDSTDAFTAIAEKIKDIQSPAERVAVTMEIMGRSGAELLPLMMQGAKGIHEAGEAAKKAGISFNAVDAAKIKIAQESLVRLEGIGEGLLNTLAIKLAPIVDVVATKLVNMANSGKGAGAWISNALENVGKAVAWCSDILSIYQAEWNFLRAGASLAIGGILNGIGYLIDGINKVTGLLHITAIGGAADLHKWGNAFIDTSKTAAEAAVGNLKDFHDGKYSKAVTKGIADMEAASNKAAAAIAADAGKTKGAAASTENFAAKLQQAAENAKQVTSTLADLQKQVATFGMTEGAKKAFDLKALGATPEQIASAQKLVDQLEKLGNATKATDALKDLQKEFDQFSMTDAQKKVADLKLPGVDDGTLAKIKAMADKIDGLKEAKTIFDDTRTPMEKYETQIGKLGDLLNSGAINWDTYGRAVRKARAELEKAAETKSPDLMVAGSAQAQQFVYQQQHHVDAFNNAPGIAAQNASKDKLDERQFNETFQSRLILQQIRNYMADQTTQTETVVDIA